MSYRNLNELYRIMGGDFSSNINQTLNTFLTKVDPLSNAALIINFLKSNGINGDTTIKVLLYSEQYSNLVDQSIRLVNRIVSTESNNKLSNDYSSYVNPKLSGIGGGVITTTYSQLTSNILSSGLTAGSLYLISDFRTCYDRPDYDKYRIPIGVSNDSYVTTSVDPIIVLATSSNTLAQEAYQPSYPNDKIKYDVTYNQTESNNPAFGRITERIDENGNRTDYDHRTIEFKRYRLRTFSQANPLGGTVELQSDGTVIGTDTQFTNLSPGDVITIQFSNEIFYEIVSISADTLMTVTGETISSTGGGYKVFRTDSRSYDSYFPNNIDGQDDFNLYKTFEAAEDDGCTNTYIGDHSKYFLEYGNGDFLLANNVFKDGSYRNNTIGDSSYNNTFNDDCTSNRIGYSFRDNITDNDFDNNVIGDFFTNNIITSDFEDNQIGTNFEGNVILCNDFYRNRIGNDFRDNWFDSDWGFDFQNNQIGNQFNNNYIYRPFYKNVILNGYNDNQNWGEFYGNKIGNGFNDNEIYTRFNENQILDLFENNTIGDSTNIDNYNFENNVIGNRFKGNYIQLNFWSNRIKTNFKGNITFQEFGYNNLDFGCFGNTFSGETIHNTIGKNFYSNNLSGSFSYNTIGADFDSNNIGDGFGYGGGTPRGNKIGNNFYNNNIGEYFYDNIICDGFVANTTIGNYFQFNNIKQPIASADFSPTQFYQTYNCEVFRASDNSIYFTYFDGTTVQYSSLSFV